MISLSNCCFNLLFNIILNGLLVGIDLNSEILVVCVVNVADGLLKLSSFLFNTENTDTKRQVTPLFGGVRDLLHLCYLDE